MGIKNIITGHVNELLGNHEELHDLRINICQTCPLYKLSDFGYVCDPKKYLNPLTNEVSYFPKAGYFKGCNCRLEAKTRDKESSCPARKW